MESSLGAMGQIHIATYVYVVIITFLIPVLFRNNRTGRMT